ncbi:hypothetical protein NM208_g4199 [Fusarium decemcellulare]|uniref:Uncharacterized protein n=1 Tax=Fusarium decemcellulare TaxID=57161 RepID=A0ACC1SLM5_9HYPO|nr:hypothetical protein NM208_g4199 [Fusarium decemcellulare]
MGQYWNLINIDKRRELRHVGGLKLWEFLMSTSAEQLVGLLHSPKWLNFRIPSGKIMFSKQKSLNSPLIRLPQEIVDLIIPHLHNDQYNEDLVCLALTCSYFFRLVAHDIQKTIRKDTGPWAGDRIIFVGDYATGYPDNIATPEEAAEWAKLGRNPLYGVGEKVEAEGRHAAMRSLFREEPFIIWGKCLQAMRQRLDENDGSIQRFERLRKLLMSVPKHLEPAKRQGVLRNLVTKQYIRDQTLAESDYAYSLGEALLCYITWTEDPSGLEGLPLEGEWAGHRFDVTIMDEVTGDEWTDVSQEAIGRLSMVTGEPSKNGRRLTDDE